LQDFIKHGEDKALIEIELADEPKNTIIRRTFEKGSNSSKWSLDGSSTNEGEIKKYVAKMNIQVDNLCQFLPQDKVASFAQMDAPKLLRETERAAGTFTLNEHDKLITLQKELKALEAVFAVD
jgi:chromosome segregation ATPase